MAKINAKRMRFLPALLGPQQSPQPYSCQRFGVNAEATGAITVCAEGAFMTQPTYVAEALVVTRPDGLFAIEFPGLGRVLDNHGRGYTYRQAEMVLDEIENRCRSLVHEVAWAQMRKRAALN